MPTRGSFQPDKKKDVEKILRLSKNGVPNAQIAEELGITPSSVSNSIYRAKDQGYEFPPGRRKRV